MTGKRSGGYAANVSAGLGAKPVHAGGANGDPIGPPWAMKGAGREHGAGA